VIVFAIHKKYKREKKEDLRKTHYAIHHPIITNIKKE